MNCERTTAVETPTMRMFSRRPALEPQRMPRPCWLNVVPNVP